MCTADAGLIAREVYSECSKVFPGRIRDAYLYGSYARGDFDSESDIDILLTVDADSTEISRRRYDLAEITSSLSLKHDITVSVTAKPLSQFRQYSEVLPFYKKRLAGRDKLCGMKKKSPVARAYGTCGRVPFRCKQPAFEREL